MIDDLTILLSLGLVLFTIVRAIRLDRALPWFDASSEAPQDDVEASEPPPWRRSAPSRVSRRPLR